MGFMKRNLALILLGISSILILSAFSYAFIKKDDVTFYLKDIKGDQAALNDITIAGVLQDRFHGQYFEIKEGKVNHRFKYFNTSSDFVEPSVNYINGISSGDLAYWFQNSYEVTPDADTKTTTSKRDVYSEHIVEERTISANKVELFAEIRVRHKDLKSTIENDSFSINTGIIVEADEFEYEIIETVGKLPDGTEYTMSRWVTMKELLPINNDNLSNCMTLLDGKIYFVVPTTKKCSGENGIFIVDEFEAWWRESAENGQRKKVGKGRKIVKIDLNDHNIDVLGLEAINEQLVLTMLVDNFLTLRTYDKYGNFIDEICLEDIDMHMIGNSPIVYESFINGNILNLSLNIGSYGSAQAHALVSVEIGDKIKEKHIIQKPDFINEVTQHYNIYEKDNKLYIITNVQSLTENSILRPGRFIIMVYENAKLLYKGELVTDADEDLEIERLKAQTGSFAYNLLDFRHFANIELR